jgi:LuxR family transcriptional regulator, quorum-sensing system regulator SolR
MIEWQETRMQALLTAKDENAVFAVLSSMAEEIGFNHCAYGMRMPLPVSRPKLFTINNYNPNWQSRYVLENYIVCDPTVAHGARSVLPLIWSDEVFEHARPLWEDARAHGLRVGWAQSCHDAQGVGGLLTLARSDDSITAAELRANLPKMTWLVQAVHTSMARILVPKLMPEAASALSTREVEVLRWTGDGKTSSEIGDIMSLSEHTVNFHVKNALVKLNATNKTAGVVKAVMMGML